MYSVLENLRCERNYSKETLISYQKDLSQFIEYSRIENDSSILCVKPEQIREWIIFLMDRGYMSSSVNRKLSALRSFYRFLQCKGRIESNPLVKISAPKCKKTLPVFVKEGAMDLLLDQTDFGAGFEGCRNRLVIQMFYVTGMRLAELIGLNDLDIDFSMSVLMVIGKRNTQSLIPFDWKSGV